MLAAIKKCAMGKPQLAWHNGLSWGATCEGLTRQEDSHAVRATAERTPTLALNGIYARELFDIWEGDIA